MAGGGLLRDVAAALLAVENPGTPASPVAGYAAVYAVEIALLGLTVVMMRRLLRHRVSPLLPPRGAALP